MIRKIKLLIEYDGTNYRGWQVQAQGETIQGVIEERLARILGEPVRLVGSGRTDAGAHACGQVAHFTTRKGLDLSSLHRALNSLLPEDILVLKVEEVDEAFHARRGVKSKIYEYRILNRPLRPVFDRFYAWHIPYPLDWEEVKRATQRLVGRHDFSAFRSTGSPAKSAIREVFRAEWREGGEGLMRFQIEANGFLKQMVRAIVGTLIEVGKGKIDAEGFQRVIDSKDRRMAGPTAPAHGLFLKEVKY
ncbi:MAG: tRNA pseudouridine(38-40) synthase TruA [Desulfobacterota bacterium]|nr:tRNA pseudouridine(38-40) synthase TruA [Thermodesulfobacteriota bacterium]